MKKIIILTTVLFFLFSGLSFAAQKTITQYMRAGDMGSSIPPNPNDFVTNNPTGAMSGDLAHNTLSLGNDVHDSSGSYIYGGDSDIAYCVQGKCIFGIGLRAYFEFTFQDQDSSSHSTDYGDGFTFFIINGSNNTRNSSGGAPAGLSMGELLGYGGPGRTDGLGLQPPKMAIEFDVFPNNGSTNLCTANSRNDVDNSNYTNNHMALMFWGDNPTGSCTVGSSNYPMSSFDDNQHGAGSGNNPVNSSSGDVSGGYYAGAKNGSYNWLEDGQLHRFRLEITRSTTPVSSKYAYNIMAWIDCPGCTSGQLTTFQDLTASYNSLAPQINRTVSLVTADHQAFNTMLFGWGFATGAATQTIGIQNFSIYFPKSSCGYGTNPASASVGSAASSGNIIGVLAGPTCAWTAVSDSLTWLTIPSGSGNGTGTGNGSVSYNVSANTGALRTGNITIADQVFTVTQASGCSYAVASVTTSYTASGGNDTYSVTTNSSCPWTTSNNGNTWITVTPASATGSTTTGSITVAANTGVARTGQITIAGQTFTISQASGCSYTVASVTTSYAASGGNDTYSVTTNSSCPWTTSNNGNTWITVTPSSATGSTTTGSITVAANTGIARSGQITIAGQTFTINQSNGCSYSFGACPSTFASGGGTQYITVTTDTGCTWTATDNQAWITTSPASSSGAGSVTVTVSSHTPGNRSGTETIKGTMGTTVTKTCTINQN